METRAGTGATLNSMKCHLRTFARAMAQRDIGPMEVKPATVENYLRGKSLAMSSVRQYRMGIRAFLEWGGGSAPPRLRPRPRGRTAKGALTKEEVVALWKAAETHREKSILGMGLHSGMRAGEMAEIKWGDILDETARMTMKGRHRMLYFDAATRREMNLYAARERPEPKEGRENVLLTRSGQAADSRTINLWVKAIGQRAGLAGITSHRLRHTFAAELREGGADLQTISDLLGHAQLDTTRIYAKARPDWMRQQIAAHHSGWQRGKNESKKKHAGNPRGNVA